MAGNDLRIGNIAKIYYDTVLNQSTPKQLRLLDAFFPDLLVREVPSDRHTKVPAEFNDLDGYIHAVRCGKGFYTGSSPRVIQILGRLTGTARGSVEKERRTAGMIQTRIAGDLANDIQKAEALRDLWAVRFASMDQEQLDLFIDQFTDYLNAMARERTEMSPADRENELFPIREEVFHDLWYNIAAEWTAGYIDGYANAFTWLTLGALLRDEIYRVIYVYDPQFVPRREHPIHADHDYYYEGDDLDRRFPGIEWYCDRCGAYLNDQEGFDDHHHFWKCRVCGYKNPIGIEEIYDSEEDYRNHIPTDRDMFFKALRERTEELEGTDPPGNE